MTFSLSNRRKIANKIGNTQSSARVYPKNANGSQGAVIRRGEIVTEPSSGAIGVKIGGSSEVSTITYIGMPPPIGHPCSILTQGLSNYVIGEPGDAGHNVIQYGTVFQLTSPGVNTSSTSYLEILGSTFTKLYSGTSLLIDFNLSAYSSVATPVDFGFTVDGGSTYTQVGHFFFNAGGTHLTMGGKASAHPGLAAGAYSWGFGVKIDTGPANFIQDANDTIGITLIEHWI